MKDSGAPGFIPKAFARKLLETEDVVSRKCRAILRELYHTRKHVWLAGKEAATK